MDVDDKVEDDCKRGITGGAIMGTTAWGKLGASCVMPLLLPPCPSTALSFLETKSLSSSGDMLSHPLGAGRTDEPNTGIPGV